jgi:hypothetical protein
MTTSSEGDTLRRQERAERLFTGFDFGLPVKDSSGWTTGTIKTPEGLVLPTLKKTVFFEPEDGSSESLKGEFEVIFQGRGDLLVTFYTDMPGGRILLKDGGLELSELVLLAAITRQAKEMSSNEPKTILIVVEGGVIQDIEGIPPGVQVVVRDYDVDGSEENIVEDGSYVETVYVGPSRT